MENIQTIISIILSIITLISVVYKSGLKEGRDRERKYYETVLQPFIESITQNKNINVLRLLRKLVKRTDDLEMISKILFYAWIFLAFVMMYAGSMEVLEVCLKEHINNTNIKLKLYRPELFQTEFALPLKNIMLPSYQPA